MNDKNLGELLARDKFLVSKETVVLCQWEIEAWKFGFIEQVHKGQITTVKDFESWHLEY